MCTLSSSISYLPRNQLLKERCLATEQCIGFTSDGEFKNRLAPVNKWVDISPGQGMYVAGEYIGGGWRIRCYCLSWERELLCFIN